MSRLLSILILIAWLWHRKGVAEMDNGTVERRHGIEKLLDSGRYDYNTRPLFDTGEAVRVEVDVVLNTLGPVVERQMEMTASFYLRQQWREPRLAYQADNLSQPLLLNHRRVRSLWLPDLFFSQGKDEQSHDVTVPNVLIRLYPDGTILYSQRLTVTFQCLMDLRKFPLDDQICYIRMESYSHTTDEMFFAWSSERKSMDILENAHIPDFELRDITTHDCTATYATGTFPCLEAQLKLSRQIGFYMIQTYIPNVLIVSLSWVSFWLDTHAIPARISVGLLTVLTITTQSSGARSELPRVPYTKSIDVWMSVCLVFVFAAYMQYAFVTVFSRAHRKIHSGSHSPATNLPEDKVPSLDATVPLGSIAKSRCHSSLQKGDTSNGTAEGRDERKQYAHIRRNKESTLRRRGSMFQLDHESRDLGRVVDKWSRAVFPLAFLCFNVGYWVYYTQSAESRSIE